MIEKLLKNQIIGTNSSSWFVESTNKEILSLRGTDSNSSNSGKLRVIPTPIVEKVYEALKSGNIEESDISTGEVNGSHLFDKLNIQYDKFIAGYASTIKRICEKLQELEELSPIEEINCTYDTHLPKPFILLAGISGTGKTRFVRKQAEFFDKERSTYEIVSVRPDWHEPSDVLGYTTRLGKYPQYVATDVLKFIVKAWKAVFQNPIELPSNGRPVSGDKGSLESIPPYWLCLDEMNLAPVEQYFSDYLSVLETREWEWDHDQFIYDCEPLLKSSALSSLCEKGQADLKGSLELTGDEELWQYFLQHGITIPFNLIVAGTVNMDETTHGFSRKVIDRAVSIDFGEFFPNDYEHFFQSKTSHKVLSYPIYSGAFNHKDLVQSYDADLKSKDFLEAVNQVLEGSPFALAYRALNELFLSVISHGKKEPIELQAVWDDFMMSKVLPRIEGDIDKLGKSTEDNILTKLNEVLAFHFTEIWENKERPDLFREYAEKEGEEKVVSIPCRSKKKLQWMNEKLENGYTTFWP